MHNNCCVYFRELYTFASLTHLWRVHCILVLSRAHAHALSLLHYIKHALCFCKLSLALWRLLWLLLLLLLRRRLLRLLFHIEHLSQDSHSCRESMQICRLADLANFSCTLMTRRWAMESCLASRVILLITVWAFLHQNMPFLVLFCYAPRPALAFICALMAGCSLGPIHLMSTHQC